jgi:hypothetical protein
MSPTHCCSRRHPRVAPSALKSTQSESTRCFCEPAYAVAVQNQRGARMRLVSFVLNGRNSLTTASRPSIHRDYLTHPFFWILSPGYFWNLEIRPLKPFQGATWTPNLLRRCGLEPDNISLVPASLKLRSIGANHNDTKVFGPCTDRHRKVLLETWKRISSARKVGEASRFACPGTEQTRSVFGCDYHLPDSSCFFIGEGPSNSRRLLKRQTVNL